MRAFYRRQKGGGRGRAQGTPELGSLHLVTPVAQGCAGERLLISRVQWFKEKVLYHQPGNGLEQPSITEGEWKYTLDSDEGGGGRQVHIASPGT